MTKEKKVDPILEQLQERFSRLGLSASEFCRDHSCLAKESYTTALFRGISPGSRNLMIMMSELGFTSAEVRDALLSRGEDALARLIDPTPITGKEQEFLALFRQLDLQKSKLILDMLKNLTGK